MAAAIVVVGLFAIFSGAWVGYLVARRLTISEQPSLGIGPWMAIFWTWNLRLFLFLIMTISVSAPVVFLLSVFAS